MSHLLHGRLHVTIYEVNTLHIRRNFNPFSKRTNSGAKVTSTCPKKFLTQLKNFLLCQCQPEVIPLGLYATVDLDKARVGRTRMLDDQPSNPKWNESFNIYCAHLISHIIFTVKQDNPVGATLIGRAYVPVDDQVLNGNVVDTWAQILDENHHPIPGDSKIHVRMQFFDVRKDINWSQGIRLPQFQGVPNTFFNLKTGCKVTLYQDAHVPDGSLPQIPLSGRKNYEPKKCWEDIYNAILDAKHFIYITGWSVYTEITLVRDQKKLSMTLGELLKKKADEGVKVLMLVWDDRTSVPDLKKDGLMTTHDQETEQYFRNTNVHCVLCPRNPDDGRSFVQGFEISTMFTHHQKTVILDSQVPGQWQNQKRTVVSFVGGIDLCDGRYDTQEHPLFSTLNSVHRDDFHQPNFPGASIKKGGPREPWHDIHCKLEGPVAWDVMCNFEQRWDKQIGKHILLLSSNWLDEILVPKSTAAAATNDNEAWNVQVFRSIDGGAVSGFPQDPQEAAKFGLVSGKDNIIDRSIQDAYINAIRRAKKFIYIENQYFLGSSYGWHSSDIKVEDINALHLIPKELSLKIVSKIEAGERFSVYIVIPMWPEGVPDSGSVQAILDWQRRTMEMMYSDIAEAIRRKGIRAHPRDYLTFFCLGNREGKKDGEFTPTEAPEPDSDYSRAQKSRRFMIYVHAKMMIVDDEYIIIGSANINQRSMDGARDSEIAMGAFQPSHLSSNGPPRGQIYGFRRALWYEHMGETKDTNIFNNPESAECIKVVNNLADSNWDIYSKETFDERRTFHHLMRYPIEVTSNGTITTLAGFEHFPDTKAKVLGSRSDYLPPILTT